MLYQQFFFFFFLETQDIFKELCSTDKFSKMPGYEFPEFYWSIKMAKLFETR